ncbi:hypothetical protein BS78_04G081800 [Paspalum vaginatum]|nr:hypothetical protein BS78_04G081800 [Paspalum vaginatum]
MADAPEEVEKRAPEEGEERVLQTAAAAAREKHVEEKMQEKPVVSAWKIAPAVRSSIPVLGSEELWPELGAAVVKETAAAPTHAHLVPHHTIETTITPPPSASNRNAPARKPGDHAAAEPGRRRAVPDPSPARHAPNHNQQRSAHGRAAAAPAPTTAQHVQPSSSSRGGRSHQSGTASHSHPHHGRGFVGGGGGGQGQGNSRGGGGRRPFGGAAASNGRGHAHVVNNNNNAGGYRDHQHGGGGAGRGGQNQQQQGRRGGFVGQLPPRARVHGPAAGHSRPLGAPPPMGYVQQAPHPAYYPMHYVPPMPAAPPPPFMGMADPYVPYFGPMHNGFPGGYGPYGHPGFVPPGYFASPHHLPQALPPQHMMYPYPDHQQAGTSQQPVQEQQPGAPNHQEEERQHPYTLVQLGQQICAQIEYYFSDRNLSYDFYLKQHMDEEGWVPLAFVAAFPRISEKTNDIDFVLNSILSSNEVEVQGTKLRKRSGWEHDTNLASDFYLREDMDEGLGPVGIGCHLSHGKTNDLDFVLNSILSSNEVEVQVTSFFYLGHKVKEVGRVGTACLPAGKVNNL